MFTSLTGSCHITGTGDMAIRILYISVMQNAG